MTDPLRPYLLRSFGAHGALLAGLALFGGRAAVKSDKVYTIDFVGATSIQSAGPSAAPKGLNFETAAPRPAPQADPDEWASGRRKPGSYALPRPSLLKGWKDTALAAPIKPSMSQGAGTTTPNAAPGGAAGDAGVATDLPNFPYPWYISQIRLMLWQAWQKRMPGGGGEGVVVFSILRNGTPTDLRMSSSSGDSGFDTAAVESVQAAAPFPALPSGFGEPFLKIHLTLRSQ